MKCIGCRQGFIEGQNAVVRQPRGSNPKEWEAIIYHRACYDKQARSNDVFMDIRIVTASP